MFSILRSLAPYLIILMVAVGGGDCIGEGLPGSTNLAQEVSYSRDRKPDVPWSINVLRISRRAQRLALHTLHADSRALGLATVGEQALGMSAELGSPVAAINGDFYERQGLYAGDPRGLQIVEGELISAPADTASFWIDAAGEPHLGITSSQFQVTWPNGQTAPLGLNEDRRSNQLVLYTAAAGSSTRTRGGRELVLEPAADTSLETLRVGQVYRTRIREVRNSGNSPLLAETLVLSIGPGMARSSPPVAVGAELQISMTTLPNLKGARMAISGGPVLVKGGKPQRIRELENDSFQSTSQFERHPRSAIGWNQDYFFLVEVDGRQPQLSVGMTLTELAGYLAKLGCSDAMNLDGGGSATIWYDGRVRNRPCDGRERPVANSIVVARRDLPPGGTAAGRQASGAAAP